MNKKDFARGKWEARKRKERELKFKQDVREREFSRGYKGKFD